MREDKTSLTKGQIPCLIHELLWNHLSGGRITQSKKRNINCLTIPKLDISLLCNKKATHLDMNNSRNSYTSGPNHTDRSSGSRFPAFSSRNAWSMSGSIVNRRLLDESPSTYSRTTDLGQQPSHNLHRPHQIPIRNSNNPRRHHLESLRQAVHNQPARSESNSRSTSQAIEEDDVLKHLTKETYNPLPKNLLLKNLSLYYRNKNSGIENSSNFKDYSGEEDEKRCTVCLEDFEPKETVMLTPCKHMFHEECIVPWLKSKGQCPLCRFVIIEPAKQDTSPAIVSDFAGDVTVNDLFTLDLISVVRAMEESFLFGYPRRL